MHSAQSPGRPALGRAEQTSIASVCLSIFTSICAMVIATTVTVQRAIVENPDRLSEADPACFDTQRGATVRNGPQLKHLRPTINHR